MFQYIRQLKRYLAVNTSDQNTLNPVSYSLGDPSERLIIHQQDDLFVAHELLFQNATPTRFYQHNADTFIFLIKGELYLQQDTHEKETVLKIHQGIWLAAHTINTVTLLTPKIELCIIRLGSSHQIGIDHPFKKISSGTVELVPGRSHVKIWPLWQGASGQIALELYPPHYKETLYYQKTATQYLLPLNGSVLLSDGKKPPRSCPTVGKIIAQRERRAILNPSQDSISLLSVMTSPATKGRILVLTKPNIEQTP